MKRNFDEVILDLDGIPVRCEASPQTLLAAINDVWPQLAPDIQTALGKALDAHAGPALTLRTACLGALMGAYEDERNLSDDERMARMELARRIHKGGVQDIEPKDRDRIKPLLKKRYIGILVPVVAAELLETEAAT